MASGKRYLFEIPVYLLALSAILLALNALVIQEGRRGAASAFFAQALRQTHAESVIQIGNRTYRIRGGVPDSVLDTASDSTRFDVLRTAYARELALRSPFFSLDGTDVAALTQATTRLKELRAALADVQDTPANAVQVRTALYPTDSLDALAEAQSAREQFLSFSSPANEFVYEQALLRVLAALQHDVGTYGRAYKETEPDALQYVLPTGIVTKESTLRAVATYADTLSHVAQKMTDRNACLQGEVERCNILATGLPFPSEPTLPAKTAGTPLPDSVTRAFNITASVEGASMADARIFVTDNTACTKQLPFPNYVTVRRASGDDTLPDGVSYVGSLLFYDGGKLLHERGASMLQYLFNHGIRYVPTHPTSFYVCPAIGSLHGQIFGAETVQNLFSMHPQLKELGVVPDNPKEGTVYVPDIVQSVRHALAQPGTASLSQEDRDTLFESAGILRNNSAGFEFLVQQIVYVGEQELLMQKAGAPVDLSAARLLSTQSGFPSLFLAYNRSATGLDAPVSLLATTDGHLVTQELLVPSDLPGSDQTAQQQMMLFRNFHKSPETF